MRKTLRLFLNTPRTGSKRDHGLKSISNPGAARYIRRFEIPPGRGRDGHQHHDYTEGCDDRPARAKRTWAAGYFCERSGR